MGWVTRSEQKGEHFYEMDLKTLTVFDVLSTRGRGSASFPALNHAPDRMNIVRLLPKYTLSTRDGTGGCGLPHG